MNTMNKVEPNKVLDKKDLTMAAIRWEYGSQLAWSYSKMQAPGYLYSIYPALKKIYADDPEGLQNSLQMHLNFFNTNPMTGNVIVGITLGMEEVGKKNTIEAIDGIKTGLMGPFAGIGDTIFGVIVTTIFGSIAAYMGLQGNFIGLLIWVVVLLAVIIYRIKSTHLGYLGGTKLITEYSDRLHQFTAAAIVLGLVVIGGLIPTIIRANLNESIVIGEVPINLQEMANMILPNSVSLLIVLLCYKLLAMKWMNSTKLIFMIMILGIILSVTKILV
ncbi:MAG: PTS system mannose/fructose/sorbose family transporter subunit IID [Mycoplasmatales bacterium]